MKLIQYRFSQKDIPNSSRIGDEVQKFFATVGDVNLCSIQAHMVEKDIRTLIKAGDLSPIISASFEQSFSRTMYSDKWKSVRSTESCRFIVVEYDGLVRICYSNDDDIIRFDLLSPDGSDISEWLITTDVFDWL